MKKSIVILLHTGVWACYVLLVTIILAAAFRGGNNPPIGYVMKLITGFAVVPSVTSFYLFYSQLFPRYLQNKKIAAAIGVGVLFSVGSAAIGSVVLSVVFGSQFMFFDGGTSFLSEFSFITFIAAVSGMIGLVLKGFISWYSDIKLKEELQQKNHEVEMSLVKAQLDPHFLFNTLNNIDVLIHKGPSIASSYLNKLSDIMRFMLFETKGEEVALPKEIEYIKKYIDLQKIRSSNPAFVKFELRGETDNRLIAPLLFLPFIENAFKHVADKKEENAIVIEMDIEDDRIEFECINNFEDQRKPMSGYNGLGNELIQRRLNLLYPNRHTLKFENHAGHYKVALTIRND